MVPTLHNLAGKTAFITHHQGPQSIGPMKFRTFARPFEDPVSFLFNINKQTCVGGWYCRFTKIVLKKWLCQPLIKKKETQLDHHDGFLCQKWCFIMMVHIHSQSKFLTELYFSRLNAHFHNNFHAVRGQN